jgi:hypothetical protein
VEGAGDNEGAEAAVQVVSIIDDVSTVLIDDPRRRYYELDRWMSWFVIFILYDMISVTTYTLAIVSIGNTKLIMSLIPTTRIWAWIPFNQFIVLSLYVLCALLLKSTELNLKVLRWTLPDLSTSCTSYYFLGVYLISATFGFLVTDIMMLVIFCVYVVSCVVLGLMALLHIDGRDSRNRRA